MTSEEMANRRCVLITGTSTGIGRACAVRLMRAGFVVLAAARDEKDAPTIEACDGCQIAAIRLDVADAASIAAARERVEAIVGEAGLCGLVNNAGISVVGPVEHVPILQWRRQFEVNLFGQIAVLQAMLPLMRRHVARRGHGSARIVNMSSIAGRVGYPILGPYSASKHALEAVSDALRFELRRQGIHVCVIEPGAVKSEIWRKGQEQTTAFPPDSAAWAEYGEEVRAVEASAQRSAESAIPAERVAEAVLRCLNRKTPPTRTLVGGDAKSGALARWLLPDRLFDAVIARHLGL